MAEISFWIILILYYSINLIQCEKFVASTSEVDSQPSEWLWWPPKTQKHRRPCLELMFSLSILGYCRKSSSRKSWRKCLGRGKSGCPCSGSCPCDPAPDKRTIMDGCRNLAMQKGRLPWMSTSFFSRYKTLFSSNENRVILISMILLYTDEINIANTIH